MIDQPPSTKYAAPVTNDASSDERKYFTFATSSDVPIRPNTLFEPKNFSVPAGSGESLIEPLNNGVSMAPGTTQFTRILCCAKSKAIVRVSVSIAPFEEA